MSDVQIRPERSGDEEAIHAVTTAAFLEARTRQTLGPVPVVPEHRGRGVGSRLVREALARLRTAGAHGCVLVGEPAYYGRFGFRPRGLVRFHAAFEAKA